MGRARQGERFFVHANQAVSCPLARHYLGLEAPEGEAREALIQRLVEGWDEVEHLRTAERFLEGFPTLPFAEECFISYFPISEASPEPDIVVVVGSVEEIYLLVKKNTYQTGERILSTGSGIGAICGECTSYPLKTGKANISVGCDGSRREVGLENGELFFAVPGELSKRLHR